MMDWVLSQEGDRWSVKFDVRDLRGHVWILPFRGWSATLAARVRLAMLLERFLSLLFPWVFMVGYGWSGLCISRLLFMAIEASLLASDSLTHASVLPFA